MQWNNTDLGIVRIPYGTFRCFYYYYYTEVFKQSLSFRVSVQKFTALYHFQHACHMHYTDSPDFKIKPLSTDVLLLSRVTQLVGRLTPQTRESLDSVWTQSASYSHVCRWCQQVYACRCSCETPRKREHTSITESHSYANLVVPKFWPGRDYSEVLKITFYFFC
jgi:hypothetical protein